MTGRRSVAVPRAARGERRFVAITAMFWRSRFKYGARAYRFTLLEAGHVAQNFAARGRGARACCGPDRRLLRPQRRRVPRGRRPRRGVALSRSDRVEPAVTGRTVARLCLLAGIAVRSARRARVTPLDPSWPPLATRSSSGSLGGRPRSSVLARRRVPVAAVARSPAGGCSRGASCSWRSPPRKRRSGARCCSGSSRAPRSHRRSRGEHRSLRRGPRRTPGRGAAAHLVTGATFGPVSPHRPAPCARSRPTGPTTSSSAPRRSIHEAMSVSDTGGEREQPS